MINRVTIALSILLFIGGCSEVDNSGKMPDRILLNLTQKPESSMAVSWQTIEFVEYPKVEVAVATSWSDFENNATSFTASSEIIDIYLKKSAYHHAAIIDSLKPNTKYLYRVGGDEAWSEWNSFITARSESSPFSFTYLGDIQHDVKKFGSRLLRSAYGLAPNSSFWLFTGDVVDKAERDYQWNDFFYAADFIPKVVPFVLCAGNHEYTDTVIDGKDQEILAELWRLHINQPKTSIAGLDETVFYFDYQGVRFIILNGNEKLQEQSIWLESVLSKNPNSWTIVAIHQPIYSMSKGRDQRKTKTAFLTLFDKYGVDLVLQGHDHVYARTHKLYNNGIVGDNEKGIVYVTSNSGSDNYKLISSNSGLTVKWENKQQLFQVISIDQRKLIYKSYTAIGTLYDSFELIK